MAFSRSPQPGSPNLNIMRYCDTFAATKKPTLFITIN